MSAHEWIYIGENIEILDPEESSEVVFYEKLNGYFQALEAVKNDPEKSELLLQLAAQEEKKSFFGEEDRYLEGASEENVEYIEEFFEDTEEDAEEDIEEEESRFLEELFAELDGEETDEGEEKQIFDLEEEQQQVQRKDGLLQEYTLVEAMQLGATEIRNVVYSLTGLKEYTDRFVFMCSGSNMMIGTEEIPQEEVTVWKEVGKRFYEFPYNGEILRWDALERCLRSRPILKEECCLYEQNPWIRIIGEEAKIISWDLLSEDETIYFTKANQVLRVDKAYAEHNLSRECLEYAVYVTDTHYDWAMEDYSHYTVLAEMGFMDYLDAEGKPSEKGVTVLEDFVEELQKSCKVYAKQKGLYEGADTLQCKLFAVESGVEQSENGIWVKRKTFWVRKTTWETLKVLWNRPRWEPETE